MMANLFIIAGTTKERGRSLLNSLKDNNILISINKREITYQQNKELKNIIEIYT